MIDKLKPDEILEVLKKRISDFEMTKDEIETGRIIYTGDGIAQVWGLDKIMYGELVEIDVSDNTIVNGMVMNLEEEAVGIILFSGEEMVKENCIVRRTKKVMQVPAGEGLLGRVLGPLGNPIDGKGPINAETYRQVELKGPGIVDRQNVSEPLLTGIKAIDSMVPIGRGQRELIIGDRQTGKTTIAIDTIINQKESYPEDPVYCFYVAIGQKRSSIVQLVENLEKHGVIAYTTIIAATASEPAALQYLAPYAATAMAEYFRDNGKHALVIFDDLTKHSQAYRELSLLMRRSPGREAYPGDIFYLHSRLLERAAKLSAKKGGGSLTALPIIETQEGNVSAYIPTNIISITDGQIFLEADLFNAGLRPAINVGISVSRVGGDAQIKAMKQTSSFLRIDLAQFRELSAFMQFTSDLDPATKRQLDRGKRLTEILKQKQNSPVNIYKQILILKAGISGRLDKYPISKLLLYEQELFKFIDANGAALIMNIHAVKEISSEIELEVEKLFVQFEENFSHELMKGDIDSGFTPQMALAMNKRSTVLNRNILKLLEGITSREMSSPKLEKELEQIISGSDLYEHDRFNKLIDICEILDDEKSEDIRSLFQTVAKIIAKHLTEISSSEVYDRLKKREQQSSTAISPFFAIPHFFIKDKNKFQLIIIRSRKGIYFTEKAPKVHAIFFISGSIDQRHFYLVVISALAKIVQHSSFRDNWLKAESIQKLRSILRVIKKNLG